MVILRKVDPSKVQNVWDVISHIKGSFRLATEPDKVLKELIKNDGSTLTEWKNCIDDMISDNLLGKSARRDNVTPILVFPTEERSVSDERDWYCFECHNAGDVKFCKTESCHRVFHADCVPKIRNSIYMVFTKLITNTGSTIFLKKGKLDTIKSVSLSSEDWDSQKSSYDENKCIVCNLKRVDSFSIEELEFREAIKNVHTRSKAWIPNKITEKMTGAEPYPEWVTDELEARAKLLLFKLIDMPMIQENVENNLYNKFSEYLADFLTVKHNIGIFHGRESQEYGATEFALRDVFHDLGEIVSCVDCFKHSSETIITDWFSLPCRNPHELVWAKQKGFCYWPAKVIKKSGLIYDVRFFGGKHLRAIVNYDNIKPITVQRKSLQLKNSCSLEKAINEMELLLKFMKNPSELENYVKTKIKLETEKINTIKISSSGSDTDKPLKKRKRPVRTSSTKKKGRLSKESALATPEKEEQKPSVSAEFKKPVSISSNSDTIAVASTSAETAVPMKKRKLSRISSQKGITVINEEPIAIADDDDNTYTFCGTLTKSAMEFNDTVEDVEVERVTSSTEGEDVEESKTGHELPKLHQSYNEEVEMMRKALQGLSKKEEIIKAAVDFMQTEVNRLTEKQNEQMKKLAESHKAQVSVIKRKQWCYFCEQDAIYHCCWNTAYCSVQCQKEHWQQEHKQVCRRKR